MRKVLAATMLCWLVQATPLRTIDGDTLVVMASVWPSLIKGVPVMVPERIRVLGVDTPERGEPKHAEASAFVQEWAGRDELRIRVCAEERDRFGRLLGAVYRVRDGASLADDLVRAGLAKPYQPPGK